MKNTKYQINAGPVSILYLQLEAEVVECKHSEGSVNRSSKELSTSEKKNNSDMCVNREIQRIFEKRVFPSDSQVLSSLRQND